jgi:hypothetical protein
MRDGTPSARLSAAEKLGLLTAYAATWGSLDSVQPEKACMLVGLSAPMAVSGNVMVFSKVRSLDAHNHNHHRHGGEVGPELRLDLHVLRVPSVLRRTDVAHWVLDLPAEVNELCVDVSQDLLIYVLYVI